MKGIPYEEMILAESLGGLKGAGSHKVKGGCGASFWKDIRKELEFVLLNAMFSIRDDIVCVFGRKNDIGRRL